MKLYELLFRRVQGGYIIPRGYGIAWVNFVRDEAIAMPIPLNFICGAVRWAWYWLKAPRFATRNARDAYRQGVDQGIKLAKVDIQAITLVRTRAYGPDLIVRVIDGKDYVEARQYGDLYNQLAERDKA